MCLTPPDTPHRPHDMFTFMMGSNFFFYYIQALQIIKTTKMASQVKVHAMKPSDLSLSSIITMPHSEG